MSTATIRFRRAADFTALRLGRVVLAYLALMIAIITLAPFRFSPTPLHGLTGIWEWPDLVLNVLLFAPLGFVHELTRPRGATPQWTRVALLAAGLSATIEALQIFTPDRYPSLFDLATNTLGAVLGAWLFARLARRIQGDDTVRGLALELPLMALIYLLVPLAWLVGLAAGELSGSAPPESSVRAWLMAPLSLIVGTILGTVHAAYMVPRQQRSLLWLLGMIAAWSAVAVVPGTRGQAIIIMATTWAALAAALLRAIYLLRAGADQATRRFELPTLRLVFPLFVLYLGASALLPFRIGSSTWHAMLPLVQPGIQPKSTVIFFLLEHVAAFTLLGFLTAQYQGRDVHQFRATLPRLLAISGGTSVLLQVARGFQPEHGASFALFVFTQLAAVLGGWIYVLQRAHVQALVQRRQLLAELSAARITGSNSAPSLGR